MVESLSKSVTLFECQEFIGIPGILLALQTLMLETDILEAKVEFEVAAHLPPFPLELENATAVPSCTTASLHKLKLL